METLSDDNGHHSTLKAIRQRFRERDQEGRPLTWRRARSGRGPLLTALVLAVGMLSQNGLAEEDHSGDAAEHGEEHLHKNHFAVFLGSTQSEEHHGDRDDPQFTIGVDYERRLTKVLGVGLLADYVVEGNREFLLGIPFFVHAGKSAKFEVAPSWHKIREDGTDGGVLRLGFHWEFEMGRGSISPAIFYDITEEDNLWILGLGFGRGW